MAAANVGLMLHHFHTRNCIISFDAETISKSPSPSISATKHESEHQSAFVAILAAVNVGSAAPSFSYQAIVSSIEKQKLYLNHHLHPYHIHIHTPSAFVAICCSSKVGSAAPSFSYQAIVSSSEEAETISKSPSPSISANNYILSPSALVAICVHYCVLGFVLHHFVCACVCCALTILLPQ